MLRALLSPINALLVLAPVSWVLAVTAYDSPWLFLTAAASLIPLAGLIGLGTEQLASRSGPAWGGFLNATFGNAAELIIALVALGNGHIELVKASITGSILGNLLLVLGSPFLWAASAGRRRRSTARRRPTWPRCCFWPSWRW
jgi:Ca2+:H+ antiporter